MAVAVTTIEQIPTTFVVVLYKDISKVYATLSALAYPKASFGLLSNPEQNRYFGSYSRNPVTRESVSCS